MKIVDILHKKKTSLVATTPDAALREAIDILSKRNIGALPVCDTSNKVVGILSERDIVRWLSKHSSEIDSVKVSDLMTSDVVTCSDEYDLQEVMSLMNDHGIRHMPVVTNGKLTAMLSSRDILQTLLEDMNAYATKMTLAYEIIC